MNFCNCRSVFFILFVLNFVSCGGGGSEGEKTASITPESIKLSVATVKQTTPSNQERDVGIDVAIDIELSAAYSTDDIIFEFKELESNTTVQGLLSSNGQKLHYTLSSPLNYSSEYTVNVSSKQTSSRTLKDYSFSFETIADQSVEKGSFHPAVRRTGNTKFSIIPIESIKENTPTKVTFGIPFPKNYLYGIDKFRLFDENGQEVAIAAKEILTWRNSDGENNSIRSVLVQLELAFKTNEYGLLSSRDLILEWGVERIVNDLPIEPVRDSWVLVDDEEFSASDNIYEPQAYALFQPDWYGDSVIKTRLLPFNNNQDFSAYDAAFKLFGDTAINQVDPRVIDDNLIPYRDSYAAWLFDRAMTIYQLAFRAGEFKYLRAAHRASQFYLQHINDQGFFSLKPSNDMKYSYGESLVAEYILFGDERIPDTVKKMVPAWDSFDSNYKK
ncbi:Ig-like domain-containing protein [Colwellia sp. MSW7]|uniref:Ig-like domain-containing protein n=1 Tax=Colwellia maritima TaxID=2912588 RepID=A0ABS9WWK7_9GAMM|nr:Ig-like domain-containing protein [Colwellia maritima]MCI2282241.1 Ig-like domain-containing protein [Colwellia maritima]